MGATSGQWPVTFSPGEVFVQQCAEAELLWTTCLKAGITYRDSEKKELISLMRQDPQFRRFEDDIKLAWSIYTSSKSVLEEHLLNHNCWNH